MPGIKHHVKKITSQRKGRIIFYGILSSLFIVVVAAILFWQANKKQIIRETLESAIQNKSGGLYKIQYDDLELDEINGFLSVTNLRLTYDSARYNTLTGSNKAPSAVLKINIPRLVVYGVETPRALLGKEISGRKLEIKDPVIQLIYTEEGKDSARRVPEKEVYEQILGDLNEISFDTLEIANATITTSSLKTNDLKTNLAGVLIHLTDVKIDSAAYVDPERVLFSKRILLQCNSFEFISADKLYKYQADSISVDSEKRSFYTAKFLVSPQLTEAAFMQNIPMQTDRLDFTINGIEIKNIDFHTLFEQDISADSFIIQSATFKLYRDLIIRRDRKNRVGTYPQQAVEKIPVPVAIKTFLIKSAFIEYKERSDKTKRAGKVQFYNTHASISNVTNKKYLIDQNNIMKAEINTDFLNISRLSTTWSFYLDNPHGRFDIKGSLGGMNAESLNQLTVPMGPARIESGKIKSLYWNLAGSDYSMSGTVRLLYEDLKVSILEKDDDSKKLDKKGLASFAANLVIKNSNPSGNNKPRIISVENERNTNRSIFHLSWKTLFKAIKETAGIKK